MTYAPVPSRRRALAEDSHRIGAPEPALFSDVTAPVPFACAEGFWVAALIDELNYYLSPLMKAVARTARAPLIIIMDWCKKWPDFLGRNWTKLVIY